MLILTLTGTVAVAVAAPGTAAAGSAAAAGRAGGAVGPPGLCAVLLGPDASIAGPAVAPVIRGAPGPGAAAGCPEAFNTFTFRVRRGAAAVELRASPAGPVATGTPVEVTATLRAGGGGPTSAWVVVSQIGRPGAPAQRVPVTAGVARATVVVPRAGRWLVSVEFPATRAARSQSATYGLTVTATPTGRSVTGRPSPPTSTAS